MHTINDLDGLNVARALVSGGVCELTLMAPLTVIEGIVYQPESFSLSGLEAIKALHKLTGEMLEEADEEAPE